MPHSLRAKLSGLRYKGLLTDKDYQRLKKALDVVDGVQDAIAEIEKQAKHIEYNYNTDVADGMYRAIKIFCKHTGVSE